MTLPEHIRRLVDDVNGDAQMSGVPRYRHRYDDNHHTLAAALDRSVSEASIAHAGLRRIMESTDGYIAAIACEALYDSGGAHKCLTYPCPDGCHARKPDARRT